MRRHAIHGAYTECIVLNAALPLGVQLNNGGPSGAPQRPSWTSGPPPRIAKGAFGSHDLANGQIGLTWDKPTAKGLELVHVGSDNSSVPENLSRFLSDKSDRRFYLEVGTGVSSNAGGMSSKNIRSVGFRPEDVLEVKFTESKPAVQAEVILGYDGFDTSKGITLKPGEAATVSLKLEGMPLAFYGRKDGVFEGTFSMQMPESDDCNDNCLDGACYDVVNTVIDEILTHQMVEGIPLSTFIHAYPVTDCFEDAQYVRDAVVYTAQVCDNGDDAALGRIRAALNTTNVSCDGNVNPGEYLVSIVRTSYNSLSSTSTYEALFDGLGACEGVSDFTIDVPTTNTLAETCPADQGECTVAGGDWFPGGWYVDISWTSANPPGSETELCVILSDELASISGANVIVWRDEGQDYSTTKCTVYYDAEITQAHIDELIANWSDPGIHTIKLEEVTYHAPQCVPAVDTVDFVEHTKGTYGCQLYYIDLKDSECGDGDRIEDLRSAYPSLEIYRQVAGEVLGVSYDSDFDATGAGTGTQTVTAVGPDGTVDVSVTTENNAVKSVKLVLNTSTPSGAAPAAAIGDEFAADIGASTELILTVTSIGVGPANCRARYHTYVESEIKFEDPCYHERYKFEAPGAALAADPAVATSDFEFTRWKTHTYKNTDTTCNCGIAFKAKDLELCPPKEIADQIGTINSQIKIQVSGGELLGTKIGYPYNLKPFEVTYVSRAFDGTGWGENYMDAEKQTYDRYLSYLAGDNYAQRWFKNTTTKLEPCTQYDTFQVKLRSSKHSQSFSGRKEETFRYVFVVPKGTYNLYAEFFSFLTSGNPAANSLPIFT